MRKTVRKVFFNQRMHRIEFWTHILARRELAHLLACCSQRPANLLRNEWPDTGPKWLLMLIRRTFFGWIPVLRDLLGFVEQTSLYRSLSVDFSTLVLKKKIGPKRFSHKIDLHKSMVFPLSSLGNELLRQRNDHWSLRWYNCIIQGLSRSPNGLRKISLHLTSTNVFSKFTIWWRTTQISNQFQWDFLFLTHAIAEADFESVL